MKDYPPGTENLRIVIHSCTSLLCLSDSLRKIMALTQEQFDEFLLIFISGMELVERSYQHIPSSENRGYASLSRWLSYHSVGIQRDRRKCVYRYVHVVFVTPQAFRACV